MAIPVLPMPSSGIVVHKNPDFHLKFRWKLNLPMKYLHRFFVLTLKTRAHVYSRVPVPNRFEHKVSLKEKLFGSKFGISSTGLDLTRTMWLDHSTRFSFGVSVDWASLRPALSMRLSPFQTRKPKADPTAVVADSRLPTFRIKHQFAFTPKLRLEPIMILYFIPDFTFSTAASRTVGLGNFVMDMSELNLLVDLSDPSKFKPKLFNTPEDNPSPATEEKAEANEEPKPTVQNSVQWGRGKFSAADGVRPRRLLRM